MRFANHAHNIPSHPDLHTNKFLSKNLKGHRKYGAHKNVSMDGSTHKSCLKANSMLEFPYTLAHQKTKIAAKPTSFRAYNGILTK